MRLFSITLLAAGACAFPNLSPGFLEGLKSRMEAKGVATPKDVRQLSARSASSEETNCGPTPCMTFDATSSLSQQQDKTHMLVRQQMRSGGLARG
jgi:hypothetical protein